MYKGDETLKMAQLSSEEVHILLQNTGREVLQAFAYYDRINSSDKPAQTIKDELIRQQVETLPTIVTYYDVQAKAHGDNIEAVRKFDRLAAITNGVDHVAQALVVQRFAPNALNSQSIVGSLLATLSNIPDPQRTQLQVTHQQLLIAGPENA